MMSPTDENGPVVLRLIDGQSDQQEFVLEAGRPTSPLALGTNAGWRIEGRDVAEAVVMIAWNGTSLFVRSPRGGHALLDGFPLATRWTKVKTPSELRFGGARLSIARAPRRPDGTEPKGVGRDNEATSPDDERLQAALRLSRDEDATCIAKIVVPAEARRPADRRVAMPRVRPLQARPTLRPIAARPPVGRAPNSERTIIAAAPRALASESTSESDDEIASMPPTVRADGPVAAAIASFA